MKRKSKLLFLLLSLMILCTVFVVFGAATDEEQGAAATFVFKKGDEVLATQTYAEGETVGFTLNTAVKTLEIDLHNFYAKFDSVTLKKDDAEIAEDALPTVIGTEDLGHTYEIQMVGTNTIKVFAEITNLSLTRTGYVVDTTALTNSDTLKTAVTNGNTLRITFHANGAFNGLDFSAGAPLVRIDFNGQKLTAGKSVGTLFNFNAIKSGEHYLYSTKPGAEIIATNATFLKGMKSVTYNIGTVNFGTTTIIKADGANLSIACRSLLTSNGLSPTCNVDGITYRQTTPKDTTSGMSTVSALCYVTSGTDASNAKLNLKNATVYLENGSFTAVSQSMAGKISTLTVENSALYLRNSVTYRNNDEYAKNAAIVLTDSTICSADRQESLVEGKVFARCDESSAGGIYYLYEWLDEGETVCATWKDGDIVLAEEAWKKGSTPLYRETVFGTYYRFANASAPITEDTPYRAAWKSTESKITGNLTLYANISFNFYLKNDGYIKGVTYNEKTVTFTDDDLVTLSEDGAEYYFFRLDSIAPKDLSAAFRLDVTLEDGETSGTYTVMTSLVKYAASVLETNESEEAAALTKVLLDYVRETSVTLAKVPEMFAGIRAIDACLEKYGYVRPTWSKSENAEAPVSGDITGASLHLVSDPGFIFYLDATKYTAGETVSVKINGTVKDYEIKVMAEGEAEKLYISVDNIHISNYRADLNVTVGEQTFTYNLDMYMLGFGEKIPAYANALYAYSLAAEAYLAAQNAE